MKIIIIFLFLVVLIFPISGIGEEANSEITITILYDNYIFLPDTKSDWGFSCLIESKEKTVLFDTGTYGEILMHNVKQLDINLRKVDLIVLSHIHRDHIGGLMTVLDTNNAVKVYYPHSFPQEFNREISLKGADPISVNEPIQICENMYLTGEIQGPVNEQSLIVNTSKGLVIIAGCSHPGIVKIVKKAKDIWDKKIYLVMGGFHLGQHSKEQVEKIAESFKILGVEKCGATHCTGDQAIHVFKDKFGVNYIPMGVGKVISIK